MTEPPSSHIEPSLAGRTIAVPEARQLDVLAALLEKRGARVLRCPLVGIEDTPDAAAVTAWIERLVARPPDLLVIYTGEGVERLLGFAERAGLKHAFIAALGKTRKITRGPKPKRALRRLGLDAELEAAEPTTHGLVETIAGLDFAGTRVAVQLYAADQDPELLSHLRDRGADVDCVAPYVYASAAADEHVAALIGELAAGRVDAIAFTSKAQVQRLTKLARERGAEDALRRGLERVRVAAVGPVVAAEIENLGFHVDAMPEDSYSMKPLVTALGDLLGSG